jgi:hypothetical protein
MITKTAVMCVLAAGSRKQVSRPRLLECGMAVPFRDSEVAKDASGQALVSGLFAVAHKNESNHLIIDRRASNCREERLEWEELPLRSTFHTASVAARPRRQRRWRRLPQLCVFAEETWRMAGSQLHRYIGRSFLGHDVDEPGLEPYERYCQGIPVWAMGTRTPWTSPEPLTHGCSKA